VAWLSLVREYTKCKLTRDEDILIAFSGLARRWSEIFSDQYLAGLWKQSLGEGLLWHGEVKIPGYLGGEPSSVWRATSWSWASFKGAVSWSPDIVPHEKLQNSIVAKVRLIQLVDTDLVSASADQFSQLLLGSITVRAALVAGLAGSESQEPSDSQDGNANNNESLRVKLRRLAIHGPGALKFVIRTVDHEYTGFCYFDPAEMGRGGGVLVTTCLPILLHFQSCNRTRNDAEVSIQLQGIFVETVEDGQTYRRSYKRVGYFSATSKLGNIRTVWSFCQSLVGLRNWEIASRLGFGESEDIVLV
jgi:hypothetical protein